MKKSKKINQYSLMELFEVFDTEEKCEKFLFTIKYPEGFICRVCGDTHYSHISTRKQYQCSKCGKQESLKANTMMHGSNLHLRTWIVAIYLLVVDPNGASCMDVYRKLDISYNSVHLLVTKLRYAMKERNESFILDDTIEIDEFYIGSKSENTKRGRGTDKACVLVAISLRNGIYPLQIRAQVINDTTAQTINSFSIRTIKQGSVVKSDGKNSYGILGELYELRKKVVCYATQTNTAHLKWIDTIISNIKTIIQGNYHGVSIKYLEMYLEEIVWRFNRRMQTGEDRLKSAFKTLFIAAPIKRDNIWI